ncbi:MAG TPA: NmrA/HSCARG family protein [Cyclobacteriaceae bacterium]|nr:NmrA/HSCARG family protein [Cyclobacteriaceae bacterium]
MNNSTRTILVSGATGRQGGAVIRHLLKNNLTVKALSRTPESISAKRLVSSGVALVKGDMADPDSLVRAMQGCDGVFSIQNYFECGEANEIQYGKNMADASKRSNISHFVYNSVSGADSRSGVPHFETKNIIEQYVKSVGLPYTILRPVKFMENYYIPQVFKGILGGKLFDSIKAGKKHQMIAVDDIGKYVADVFARPEKHLSKTIEIAGDELTNEQVVATMSEVLGIPIKFRRLPLFAVKLLMDREMYLMFKWFNEKGFQADMEETKRTFPFVQLTSLKEFLVTENWQRWNKKGSI